MSKVRINDLARELEVKSKAILDVLTDVGVTEKKTHSSSLEADEAERVRAHFNRGGKTAGASSQARAEAEPKPKIDWSRVSKPGDVLKAIQERKEQEALAASRPAPQPSAVKPAVAPAAPAAPKQPTPQAPVAPPVEAAKPAPRRIVPQPRPAPAVVAPPPQTPAIAAKPPAGPVVAKPPVVPPETKPAVVAAPPAVASVAAKPVTPTVAVPAPVSAPAPVAAAPSAPVATSETVEPPAPATAAAPQADTAASSAPARRVIMPQTGPRPVYTAPPPSPAPTGQTQGGLQRGRPIFDRRPGGAPGQRPQGGPPGQFPGGRRPMHPTRTQPGGPPGAARPGFGQRPGFGGPRPGFGQRPGMGAPGLVPPPGEAPRPQRPGGQQRRGRQQYPKTKEGPMKGFAPPSRFGGAQVPAEPMPITRTITVTEGISVKDLAEKLEVRGKDLIATLLMRGVFVTVNQSLDAELVKDVARQFGADTQFITFEDQMANEAIESMLQQENPDELEVSRPPVVTVMGHVDHGKTSLLDAIRETDVAGGEAGGITQHIGAYKVRIGKQDSPAFGREIVFLDTPGHEAFTRMRARGAKVTDIVVIVVAADDGVMPQTLEAIDHAKAANVPMIVAVNKIDKPEAQPDRVKKQLGDRGLVPEDWGGSTVFVDVSAKKRQNLDLLLEMICLVADLGNLKATPGRSAVGTVIEAKLDRGRGAVASVLVQNGTLKNQDSFIVGNTFGKIRAMFDDRGRAIEEAGPSTPVEILGLESMPDAGDTFLVVSDRDKAKNIAQYRKMKEREAQLAKSSRVSLEGLAEQIKQAGVKELPLILKGDVQGSVEVLADSLQKMSTEKVRIKVIRSGVGAITESDVLLASASNAIIIGFNVRPERKAADLAEQEDVEIRLHSIIYELQDEIRKAMLGLLEPVFKENYLGRAEVLNVFKIPKVGTIAGCRVLDGVLRRDADVRLMRDGEQVYKGKLSSLKRFKDDAKEVTNGMECGVGLSNFNDVKVGDTIEAFVTEKVAAELTAS
ncbi:translation initiation factor IF-2 [Alloacidobacterium sp.]|uniref:translation initiation factor IF-2 n=1 Tax=Alloacidobacterium sp. TaxID=2951999 RepID=UPI002D6C9BA0|nr:translation initiation factor IF-2 [Alloacidobacterium sp.]HYK36766.1 translation initiation factor IF-2 [Alloacidobacterium sp.]